MLGLNSELESSCLPGQLRYIIHFLHAFDSDAVDLPLRPIANRFGGCFCLGSGPVFGFWFVFGCLLRCFRWRNASLAGGFAGRRFLLWLCFSFCCCIDLLIQRTFLSLYSVLSAYSHVRTEPLVRHRPHSRKKKVITTALPAPTPSCGGRRSGRGSSGVSVSFLLRFDQALQICCGELLGGLLQHN